MDHAVVPRSPFSALRRRGRDVSLSTRTAAMFPLLLLLCVCVSAALVPHQHEKSARAVAQLAPPTTDTSPSTETGTTSPRGRGSPRGDEGGVDVRSQDALNEACALAAVRRPFFRTNCALLAASDNPFGRFSCCRRHPFHMMGCTGWRIDSERERQVCVRKIAESYGRDPPKLRYRLATVAGAGLADLVWPGFSFAAGYLPARWAMDEVVRQVEQAKPDIQELVGQLAGAGVAAGISGGGNAYSGTGAEEVLWPVFAAGIRALPLVGTTIEPAVNKLIGCDAVQWLAESGASIVSRVLSREAAKKTGRTAAALLSDAVVGFLRHTVAPLFRVSAGAYGGWKAFRQQGFFPRMCKKWQTVQDPPGALGQAWAAAWREKASIGGSGCGEEAGGKPCCGCPGRRKKRRRAPSQLVQEVENNWRESDSSPRRSADGGKNCPVSGRPAKRALLAIADQKSKSDSCPLNVKQSSAADCRSRSTSVGSTASASSVASSSASRGHSSRGHTGLYTRQRPPPVLTRPRWGQAFDATRDSPRDGFRPRTGCQCGWENFHPAPSLEDSTCTTPEAAVIRAEPLFPPFPHRLASAGSEAKRNIEEKVPEAALDGAEGSGVSFSPRVAWLRRARREVTSMEGYHGHGEPEEQNVNKTAGGGLDDNTYDDNYFCEGGVQAPFGARVPLGVTTPSLSPQHDQRPFVPPRTTPMAPRSAPSPGSSNSSAPGPGAGPEAVATTQAVRAIAPSSSTRVPATSRMIRERLRAHARPGPFSQRSRRASSRARLGSVTAQRASNSHTRSPSRRRTEAGGTDEGDAGAWGDCEGGNEDEPTQGEIGSKQCAFRGAEPLESGLPIRREDPESPCSGASLRSGESRSTAQEGGDASCQDRSTKSAATSTTDLLLRMAPQHAEDVATSTTDLFGVRREENVATSTTDLLSQRFNKNADSFSCVGGEVKQSFSASEDADQGDVVNPSTPQTFKSSPPSPPDPDQDVAANLAPQTLNLSSRPPTNPDEPAVEQDASPQDHRMTAFSELFPPGNMTSAFNIKYLTAAGDALMTPLREVRWGQIVRVVLDDGHFLASDHAVWLPPTRVAAVAAGNGSLGPLLREDVSGEQDQPTMSSSAETEELYEDEPQAFLEARTTGTGAPGSRSLDAGDGIEQHQQGRRPDLTLSAKGRTERPGPASVESLCRYHSVRPAVLYPVVAEGATNLAASSSGAVDTKAATTGATAASDVPRPLQAPESEGGGYYYTVTTLENLKRLLNTDCEEDTVCITTQKHLSYTLAMAYYMMAVAVSSSVPGLDVSMLTAGDDAPEPDEGCTSEDEAT